VGKYYKIPTIHSYPLTQIWNYLKCSIWEGIQFKIFIPSVTRSKLLDCQYILPHANNNSTILLDLNKTSAQIIIAQEIDYKGYLTVSLHRHTKFVHRLVGHAFVDEHIINHKNYLRNCNYVWNLEWVSTREICIDAVGRKVIVPIFQLMNLDKFLVLSSMLARISFMIMSIEVAMITAPEDITAISESFCFEYTLKHAKKKELFSTY
jgi:hypothetical protein